MSNRRLIIRMSGGSLSFSTSEGGQVRYVSYDVKSGISMAANLRNALQTEPMLSEDYRRTVVQVDGVVLTVPTEVYHEDAAAEEYRFVCSQQEGLALMSHVVPELNVVAIFGVQKDLRQVLTSHFSEVKWEPVAASVWRHMYKRNFTGQRQKLYGYLHEGQLEVFAFQQNRFRFCNAYAVGSDINDALFYLLSAWKQLGLAPREDELHLCGAVGEHEELRQQAETYVRRVLVTKPSGEFNRAPVTQITGMPYDMMLQYVREV